MISETLSAARLPKCRVILTRGPTRIDRPQCRSIVTDTVTQPAFPGRGLVRFGDSRLVARALLGERFWVAAFDRAERSSLMSSALG